MGWKVSQKSNRRIVSVGGIVDIPDMVIISRKPLCFSIGIFEKWYERVTSMNSTH